MDKYLLEILTGSNTIIIPGLGALTITNKDTGETMFMPYLQHDDGKLAEFITAKDGIDLANAKIMVAKYVREIQAKVDKGESYDMFQLGTFVKGSNGDIEFEHWAGSTKAAPDLAVPEPEIVEAEVVSEEPEIEVVVEVETPATELSEAEGEIKHAIEEAIENTTPTDEPSSMAEAIAAITPIVEVHELIDVDETAMDEVVNEPEIEATSAEPEVKEAIVENRTDASHDDHTIVEEDVFVANSPKTASKTKEKKKRGAGFWMMMILLIGLIGGGVYFGLNYTELKQYVPFLADDKEVVKETSEAKKKMEEMLNGSEEEADSKPESEVEEPVVEEEIVEEPAPKPAVVKTLTPAASSNGAFHIVSGAFSSIVNANRLMESFKAQGLPARIIQNNGLNVVCMQSYVTSAQAQADLSNMKAKANSCWILYKP